MARDRRWGVRHGPGRREEGLTTAKRPRTRCLDAILQTKGLMRKVRNDEPDVAVCSVEANFRVSGFPGLWDM